MLFQNIYSLFKIQRGFHGSFVTLAGFIRLQPFPEALRINKYAEHAQEYTYELKPALLEFNALAEGTNLVGQNIKFDTGFLREYMKTNDIKPSFGRHQEFDLMSMAWPFVRNSSIQGLSLEALCNHFGISNEGAHEALADCYRALLVYKALIGKVR